MVQTSTTKTHPIMKKMSKTMSLFKKKTKTPEQKLMEQQSEYAKLGARMKKNEISNEIVKDLDAEQLSLLLDKINGIPVVNLKTGYEEIIIKKTRYMAILDALESMLLTVFGFSIIVLLICLL